ncbi:MAG: PEP-utilizing enzyme, partial [Ktedonobacterales bacterium]
AFTADPVSGDRQTTTISAVRGLGERLVSGEAIADEWAIRGDEATCLRASEHALTNTQALAVADLAQRIASAFGSPQDVEWAIANGHVFVLQARPMTALPEPTKPAIWAAPAPGGWMRNFRLGEWLPEPVTPLCDTWLLACIENGEIAAEEHDFGLRPRQPYHVLINGWCFSSPIGGGVSVVGALRAVLGHPLMIAALALSLSKPAFAERPVLVPVTRRWRDDLLPRYQKLVASWEKHARVETATPAELIHLIDTVGSIAGEYLWAFSVVGGHAWKVERSLAAFYRQHLSGQLALGHQELLLGLPSPFPHTPPHAVQSLDWIRPTLGEATQHPSDAPDDPNARRARLESQRRAAEATCRAALKRQPALLRRFDALLALAQRYAMLREEQAGWFTRGWPVLRRAVLRLGDDLCVSGAIERADDIFFLTRSEVEARLLPETTTQSQATDDLRARIPPRRREWERQRRLSPPLTVGKPPGASVIAQAVEVMRTPDAPQLTGAGQRDDARILRGMPASPGRATGAVRVVRGPEDFERFLPGEVLVAQVTAPAWTPLFARAAAVVTDGGSLAAHASLVAREYGIPAVVGASDATARLRDGQRVTVDGSAGLVELMS